MAKRKSMTARELLESLAADPAYQKMRQEQIRQLEERRRVLDEDIIPLSKELKAIGWDVESPWDLRSISRPYTSAIPVLLKHLNMPYIDRNLEGIARALGVPAAVYAWPLLTEAYKSSPLGSGVKHALANTLSDIATNDRLEELIELAKDRSNGASRVLLLAGIRKSRSQIARDALASLADDPDLAKQIAIWTSRRKVKASS